MILMAGCSDSIHYRKTVWTHAFNTQKVVKLEETVVTYTRNAGNSNRENILAVIGDQTNPQALLSVGKSSVDMRDYYEFWKQFSKDMSPVFLEWLKVFNATKGVP